MLRAVSAIDTIIIHCAATPNGDGRFTAREIDRWHFERGFKRSEEMVRQSNSTLPHIGYHRVVHCSGEIVAGRLLNEVGSHCMHYNTTSVGLCLIGTDKFTNAQWEALRYLVSWLRSSLKIREVIGHRDRNKKKTCPGFDVAEWLSGGMNPLKDQVFPTERVKWNQ